MDLKVKGTPKFFSAKFPGDEPMTLELHKHWGAEGDAPSGTVNVFLVKPGRVRSRVRIQLDKENAQALAAEVLRLSQL